MKCYRMMLKFHLHRLKARKFSEQNQFMVNVLSIYTAWETLCGRSVKSVSNSSRMYENFTKSSDSKSMKVKARDYVWVNYWVWMKKRLLQNTYINLRAVWKILFENIFMFSTSIHPIPWRKQFTMLLVKVNSDKES